MNLKLALAMALLLPLAGCLHESQLGPFDCAPSTGACRYEILRSDPYDELLLEISYVEGNAPDSGALDLLKQRIKETTGKSTVSTQQHAFSSDDDSYTLDEVVALEERERTRHKEDGTFVIHLLYLNGEYGDNPDALGVAYRGSSIVIFKEQVEDAAFLFVSAQDIEKAVLVHEYGHLVALVNIGYISPHDHEDADHPGHSNNEDSVMYWAVESVDLGTQLAGEPPNQFDSDDLDDLRRMREGKL
ncbi:MAG TPA: hypothetical protein EYM67_00030 [Candidatus Poseidoniales archaeon]|nr:hypothetical protein [Candidatus Poseidoniales archaeon]